MSMQINYEVDQAELAAVVNKLGSLKYKAPTVIARALNRTATTARKDLGIKAKARYTLKSAGFKKNMAIKKANAGNLEADIESKGSPISIVRFHTTAPKKQGGKANIVKGNGLKQLNYGGIKAFIGPNAQMYQRRSDKRLPIKRLSSVSIPKMLENQNVYGETKPVIEQNLHHYLEQQVEVLLAQGG